VPLACHAIRHEKGRSGRSLRATSPAESASSSACRSCLDRLDVQFLENSSAIVEVRAKRVRIVVFWCSSCEVQLGSATIRSTTRTALELRPWLPLAATNRAFVMFSTVVIRPWWSPFFIFIWVRGRVLRRGTGDGCRGKVQSARPLLFWNRSKQELVD